METGSKQPDFVPFCDFETLSGQKIFSIAS